MGGLCCKIPFLRRNVEDSGCCTSLGGIGFDWCDKNRKLIMYTCATLSFIAIALQIVPVVALSLNDGTVENTHWTFGNADLDLDVYVGLNKIVVTDGHTTQSVKWTDDVCTSGYCDKCKTACNRAANVAIISLITSLPQLTTDLWRAKVDSDLNCQKIMGILTGIIGTLGTLSALGVYAEGCYRNLPDEIDIGGYNDIDVTWSLGPGFICLLAATFVRPINFFAHLFTPTPPHKRTDEQRTLHEGLLYPSSKV